MTFTQVDTATGLEEAIRSKRLFDLPVEWANEVIFPSYADLSLRNIPHTVADALGVPLPNSAPLNADVWDGASPVGEVDRVITFLMDGMGYKHLQMLIEEDPEIRQAVSDLTDGRGAVPMTSVAPSTTAVALVTLWTGGTPAETGVTGTAMYLREFSTIGSMLGFKPMFGKHSNDIFGEWGLAPEQIVTMPGLGEHLEAHNIPTHIVTLKHLMGTGLSRILHRGLGKSYLHQGYSDLALRLEDALKETTGQRCYVGVYWSAVDSIAHMYGAHNRYTHTEIRTRLKELVTLLNNPAVKDGRTLVVILADHGHYDAPQRIDLINDAEAAPIRESMVLGLSGDNRLGQLYLRPGTVERVKQHIDETYADCLTYIDTEAALASGYYGKGNFSPRLRERLGDLLLIPRLGWTVQDPTVSDFPLVSWHGGLSDWEMLIPLLWTRV